MTRMWGIDVPLPAPAAWGTLAVAVVAAAWLAARALGFGLSRLAARTRIHGHDALGAAVRPYLFPAVLLLALDALSSAGPMPARVAAFEHRIMQLGLTFIAVTVAVRVALFLLRSALWRQERLAPVAPPILRMAKLVMVCVGALIVLDAAGISLGPVLATLGVGSVAVALALQPSLSNFFAGLYLLADRPLAPGDYVTLDSGDEGYVVHVGWRSTRIRKLQNNMVIVPNDKIASAVITNYDQPEPRMSLLIPVSVSYDSDSRRVEGILVEIARKSAGDIEGLLTEPAPFVRFIPGFGDSSLDYTLIVQVREYVDQYLVQHELRHRIFEAFRKEGIEIPFPQRTVHLRQAP